MSGAKKRNRVGLRLPALRLLTIAALATPACAWASSYTWNSGAYNDWENNLAWSPTGVPGSSDSATISDGLVTIDQAQSINTLTLSSSAAGFLYIEGNSTHGDASLTAASIDIAGGFISLTNVDGGYTESLAASLGLTVEPAGTLHFDNGQGGPRYFTGSLSNRGTVNIDEYTYLYNDAASNNLINTGSFNVDAQTTATGLNITQNAGSMTIGNDGSLTVSGGSFNYAGGSVVGQVDLTNGANLSTTVANGYNNATFRFLASASLTSNLPAGVTLVVQGNPGDGNIEVTVPNQMNNYGTIRLESIDGGYINTLTVTGNGTLNNFGTIAANPNGVGGAPIFNGTLSNAAGAHFNLNLGTTLNGSVSNSGTIALTDGTNQLNNGYFLNSAGASFSLTGANTYFLMENGAFYYAGGTVSGQVEFRDNGYLSISTTDGHGAAFLFSRNGGQLASNVPVNTFITVNGNAAAGDVTLDLPNTISNAGTITLSAQDGGYYSTLRLAAGKTFTNNGTLSMQQGGVGSNHQLIGTFINNYAVYDDGAITYLNGDFTNNNLYERQAGGITYLPAGSTFRQNANQLYIDNGGSFYVNGGTFIFSGGTINAPITMDNYPHLQTPASDGKNAAFTILSDGYIDTSLPKDTSLNVIANAAYGNINAIVRDGDSNSGAIYLNAKDGGYQSGIAVYRSSDNSYSGTYNNKGSIYSSNDYSVGGPRVITGNLANTGYVYIKTSLDVFGTVDDKAGDVSITPNQTLTIHGADNHFILDGGVLDIEKNASLSFPDGGSYEYVHGMLAVAGNLTLPSQPALAKGDAITANGNGSQIKVSNGGVLLAGGVLNANGGHIVAGGGGNIVAGGGGNIVAGGGGNIIAGGGGNAPIGVALSPDALNPLDDPASSIIADNGSITLDGGSASADGNGILRNSALLTGNGTFTASAFDVDSTSTVIATGGTLHLIGAINAYSANTLATGNWQVQTNSTLDTPNIGPITTNQASITLDGVGSVWSNVDTLANNDGTLTITHGRNFTTAGAFTNSGHLVIGPSSLFESTGAMTNTGTIDLAGGMLKLDTANLADILAQLHSGYDNGAWDGAGITSSVATADVSQETTILYQINGSAITLSLGLAGDANQDGVINADDYALLDRGLAKHLTGWSNGDFNYDGIVDSADNLMLDRTYAIQQGTLPSPSMLAERQAEYGDAYVAALVSSIPEPSCIGLGLTLTSLLFRRRRN